MILKIMVFFGLSIADIDVIEWQKRGHPHSHIVVTLDNQDKPTTQERIDAIVSAEIPDERENPILYALVKKHMLHGPCCEARPNSSCMETNKQGLRVCGKDYPKPYIRTTITPENRNPIYKRPNNGRSIEKPNINYVFTNRDVVPYNRYLLLKYRCHTNVEVINGYGIIKYLFKYLTKGHDRANVVIERNEVKDYIDCRYLSAPECVWRLNKFPMHSKSHTVYRMHIHLENQHQVIFREGEEIRAVERVGTSKLLQWFLLNRRDAEARTMLYTEIGRNYVWQRNTWIKRKRNQNKTLSRLPVISILNVELYYLRLLLLHVRGAQSFEDIRTVDGQLYPSNLEACRALHLLADDQEWYRSMSESVEFAMPYALRRLYFNLITENEVAEPLRLFETFQVAMSEDYAHSYPNLQQEDHTNMCLFAIQLLLRTINRNLSDYGLPEPNLENIPNEAHIEIENAVGEFQFNNTSQQEIYDNLSTTLNDQQQVIFDRIKGNISIHFKKLLLII